MSSISGNVTFYDNSTNDSTNPAAIVGVPLFLDSSSNQGVISSGIFSGSAFNAGEVQAAATFVGSAVNSGVVAIATFSGGAINLGTVTSSGLFYGTAVNSGVISGNAIFADTAVNNGTVDGNADFAAGASNEGGTVGTSGVYTPPSSHGNGAYSDGYYANGVIDTNYNNSTPVQAVDDSLFYTYASGVATAAHGTYSNGAYTFGSFYSSYSNGPIGASDDNLFYTYAFGVATIANAAYSNGYFVQGVNTSSAVPLQATDDSKYYVYVASVSVTLASGYYSNGYYVTGQISGTGDTLIPAQAQDDGLWRIYNSGVISLVGGPYSNGYYFNGSIQDNISGVYQAQNNNLYYSYTNGLAVLANGVISNNYYYNGTVANGAYSFGYFSGGSSTQYNSATPIQAQDNNKWYTYASGGATLANNTYSNGHYNTGEFDATYNATTPTNAAQDDDLWYTYASGVATLAVGAYSNGYFGNGVANGVLNENYNNSTPTQALDDNNWYTYVSGMPTLTTSKVGYYNDANYVNGIALTTASIAPSGSVIKYSNCCETSAYVYNSQGVGTQSCVYGYDQNGEFIYGCAASSCSCGTSSYWCTTKCAPSCIIYMNNYNNVNCLFGYQYPLGTFANGTLPPVYVCCCVENRSPAGVDEYNQPCGCVSTITCSIDTYYFCFCNGAITNNVLICHYLDVDGVVSQNSCNYSDGNFVNCFNSFINKAYLVCA